MNNPNETRFREAVFEFDRLTGFNFSHVPDLNWRDCRTLAQLARAYGREDLAQFFARWCVSIAPLSAFGGGCDHNANN